MFLFFINRRNIIVQ